MTVIFIIIIESRFVMISETYMNAIERFLQNKAMYQTGKLIKQHAVYRDYLIKQLQTNSRLEWETLFMQQSYMYMKEAPQIQHFLHKYAVSPLKKKDLILFWRWIRNKRLLKQANYEYDQAEKQYEIEKKQFEDKINDYNRSILIWKKAFDQGHPDAIARYADIILKSITDLYDPKSSIFTHYNITEKEIYIELTLPTPSQFSSIKEYRYDTATQRIVEVYFTDDELAANYSDIAYLIIIGVLRKLFNLIPALHLKYIVLNGYNEYRDFKHDLKDDPCIILLRTSRESFQRCEKDVQDNKLILKSLEAKFEEPLGKFPITTHEDYIFDQKGSTPIRSLLNLLGAETPLNFVNWNAFDYFIHQKFDFLSQKNDSLGI